MNGAVTLGEVARRAETLEVACGRCDRRGRYNLARLVERHGAAKGLPDLRDVLAADCPRQKAQSIYDLCRVHYPELPTLFPRRR